MAWTIPAFGFLLLCTTAFSAITPQQARKLRAQITENFFVLDPLPSLMIESHASFEPEPGIVAERLTYSTAYGQRIPAILYRPKSSVTAQPRKSPGLLIVNGHGGDKYSWYSFYAGILYARAGAVVLTYDAIGEGERNVHRESTTRAHDQMQEPPELARRLAGLMMTDFRQGVSVLNQRPEVDARRIGALAYSMGTFVVSIGSAVDDRLRVCVLAAGGSLDGPGGYWDTSHPMCQAIPYKSLSFLGDRAATIFALRAGYGATLVYNGLEDGIVQRDPRGPETFFADLQHRTAALHGSAKGVFETRFEPNAGHRPWFVTKPVALWLERQLGFPNWTEAAIEAMPVTHVSEWAQANGVEIEKQYATEIREWGERALGENIPALTRDQLSVFTPEEWARHKDVLTYEAWLSAARATSLQAKPETFRRAPHPPSTK